MSSFTNAIHAKPIAAVYRSNCSVLRRLVIKIKATATHYAITGHRNYLISIRSEGDLSHNKIIVLQFKTQNETDLTIQ